MKNFVCLVISFFISISLFAQDVPMNEKTKAVFDNILSRKSVRNYKTDSKGERITISEDTLRAIVRAGMAAPCAMNRQPWEFVVLSGKKEMNIFAEKMPKLRMLKSAGAAIIVLGNPEVSKLWYEDCSAAAQNILLAIEAMGLGGVWTGGYPLEDRVAAIKEALDLPDPYLPLCVIPLGYPAGGEKAKDKWKSEKLHFNKFNK